MTTTHRRAVVLVDGWAGRRELPCWVIGETAKNYRVAVDAETRLPRGVLSARQHALVPKHAVRFLSSDS